MGPGTLGFALWTVIATPVGSVDGKRRFAFGNDIAPSLKGHFWCNNRCRLGEFTPGSPFVILHRITRAMDDEYSASAGLRDNLVHAWCHFPHSLRGALAPVLVPHVANHDCGLFGLPGNRFLDHLPFASALNAFDSRSSVEFQRPTWDCGPTRQRQAQTEERETGKRGERLHVGTGLPYQAGSGCRHGLR